MRVLWWRRAGGRVAVAGYLPLNSTVPLMWSCERHKAALRIHNLAVAAGTVGGLLVTARGGRQPVAGPTGRLGAIHGGSTWVGCCFRQKGWRRGSRCCN